MQRQTSSLSISVSVACEVSRLTGRYGSHSPGTVGALPVAGGVSRPASGWRRDQGLVSGFGHGGSEAIGLPEAAARFTRGKDLSPTSLPAAWRAVLIHEDSTSFTVLVGTITLEGGWMQGGDTIEGFPSGSDFDPEEGNFFGSLGVRLSL